MQNSRPPTFRRPSNLSIKPPSPSPSPNVPALSTPTNLTNPYSNLHSPRRTALPPSPTHSNVSYASRGSSSGLGVGNRDDHPPPPPVPSKGNERDKDKKLPGIPSPHKGMKGWATGAYDNKLVSSTLSHLPPLPPLSPVPISGSSSSLHPTASSSHLHPSPRPSISNQSSSGGIVVYPDGTPLTDHQHSHHDLSGRIAESMTMAHSSPSSPWSLLTVHVLPLFAGSALKTPLEDLNHLCHSHIVSTSQRYPPSRIVSLLTADLREFIASGMLTLKAKFETLEEGKVVSRAAEVWIFFWAQVLPYVEGVFLPFTQLRDLPSTSSSTYQTSSSSPIPVRHLILSGFLLHILLPLLPRLIPQITSNPNTSSPVIPNSYPPPTTQELSKILQMSLVLSTQARYSSFFAASSGDQERDNHDDEVRLNVESLGKAVKWRLTQIEIEAQLPPQSSSNSPIKSSPSNGIQKTGSGGGLQRGPSLSQSGRYRRKGWRASANLGLLSLNQFPNEMSRQNSGEVKYKERDKIDEEDDEENIPLSRLRTNTTDSLGLPVPNMNGSMVSTLNGGSTITGGSSTITGGSTIRGESLASYGETPSITPSGQTGREMMYGRPVRRGRAESEGSEMTGLSGRGENRI
ncbi:hypothetical protein I302_107437 [Kwoniella bestiolae CBS 10118]|uniref:HbrB-like protein n=1 Tax=Kwoniella bestiolae CBS 10118 TaxID=1296100 RepID=A0A1B9FYI3_9TREE|nr:hypothetical protein I302_06822 [Kwoniella bestiolae CBS 10118]OCF23838.1 hypothetical protein I302_06822 [Kwoniella bestiolae CBS 10118]